MTPEQREELKQAALAVDDPKQRGFDARCKFVDYAQPSAILSLIAQVEALTVPQSAPSAIVDAYGSFAAFQAWAADNLGQAYSLETEDHTFIDPVTRWAFAGYRAGLQAAPTIPAIPGTKEGA